MSTTEQRRETILRLSREGLAPSWWAGKALNVVEAAYPPPDVRSHPAWARVWERPRASTWDSSASLDTAQAEWDRRDAQNTVADEHRQEREAAKAEVQRQRDAEDVARREQEAEHLKAELRRTYLALPGTTAADFERDYPQLLADHRRREMDRLEHEGDAATQAMRRTIWAAMNGAD